MRGPDDPILGYCSRLLRGGEGDPSVAPAVLAATVRAHGVAGLLLETAPMSQPALAPQRVVLMGLARQDAVRDMAATLEVRRRLDILDEAGIASLVLKGTALALWLYREPWHRARSDFDLLVPDKAAAKTVVDLLLAQGYGLDRGGNAGYCRWLRSGAATRRWHRHRPALAAVEYRRAGARIVLAGAGC